MAWAWSSSSQSRPLGNGHPASAEASRLLPWVFIFTPRSEVLLPLKRVPISTRSR